MNVAVEASFCPTCELQREKLGATRQRLAMWCTDCFSTQQLASGKCRACFSHIVKCHHCNKQDVDLCKPFRCSESDCASVFYMCATCLPYFQGREKVQCKSCWHASGGTCIVCSSQEARHDLNLFRRCRSCFSKEDPYLQRKMVSASHMYLPGLRKVQHQIALHLEMRCFECATSEVKIT